MSRTDFLGHVFKDVTPEVIKKERERMKETDKLKTIETPFGTLDIMRHPNLDDNEIRFGGKTFKIEEDDGGSHSDRPT